MTGEESERLRNEAIPTCREFYLCSRSDVKCVPKSRGEVVRYGTAYVSHPSVNTPKSTIEHDTRTVHPHQPQLLEMRVFIAELGFIIAKNVASRLQFQRET